MTEAIEEELERRVRNGKLGKLHIWALSSELGPSPVDSKRMASRVKHIAFWVIRDRLLA
ncbi:hypothetical protein GBA52_024937 [Prunus armeniaca]|nr:hypothetical protein GBA52_024937 [Prunus armeniaca]